MQTAVVSPALGTPDGRGPDVTCNNDCLNNCSPVGKRLALPHRVVGLRSYSVAKGGENSGRAPSFRLPLSESRVYFLISTCVRYLQSRAVYGCLLSTKPFLPTCSADPDVSADDDGELKGVLFSELLSEWLSRRAWARPKYSRQSKDRLGSWRALLASSRDVHALLDWAFADCSK